MGNDGTATTDAEGTVREEGTWAKVVRFYNDKKEQFRAWARDELGAGAAFPRFRSPRDNEWEKKAFEHWMIEIPIFVRTPKKSRKARLPNSRFREFGEETGREIGEEVPEVAEEIAISVATRGVGRRAVPPGSKKPGFIRRTVRAAS